MELLPLIIITIIYFTAAFTKPYFKKKLPFNICAICFAVSLTWLTLLILWFLEFPISEVSLGILMGMSLTGIMYTLEKLFQKTNIKNFWFVRLVIVVGGFYMIYSLLNKKTELFILLGIATLFSIALASFFFQGLPKKTEKKSGLIKKLDDCC